MNDKNELSPTNEAFFSFMDEVMPKLNKSDENIIVGFAMGLAAKNGCSVEPLVQASLAQQEKAPA